MNIIEFCSQFIKIINDKLMKIPYVSNYLNEIVFGLAILFIIIMYYRSKILQKYLMKELVAPFFITLTTITFVLLLDEIIELLNLIIEKNLDFLTVLNIFSLALPFLLALSIPMAVLMATILAFGRLSVDSEIIAIKSSGINIFKIVRPIYLLAFLLSVFMVYFNNQILPETNHKFSNLRMQVSMQKPMKIITPNEYIDFGKYTVIVKETSEEEMRGIIIYDRSNTQFPKTIVANRGVLIPIDNGSSLKAILYDGEMHERDAKDSAKYTITSFSEFTLNILGLDDRIVIGEREHRSDREMSSEQLVAAINKDKESIVRYADHNERIEKEIEKLRTELKTKPDDRLITQKISSNLNTLNVNRQESNYSQERIRSFQVEYHKKYSLAFACLVFALIGIPIGIMTKSSGIGTSFSVSSLIFLVYYVSLIGGERLADKGLLNPWFAMWMSNILFFIIAVFLSYTAKFERSFLDFSKIHLRAKLHRKKS
ncbi:LptF/LptG family permease [bacterium]|nr:LptF/LptG family permease [bacterium]